MDKQTKEALKQMQSEVRQLHALLAERPAEARPAEVRAAEVRAAEEPPPAAGKGKSDTKADAVVTYSISRPALGDHDAAFKTGTVSASAAQIAKSTDEGAALLGYALSSPQKVGLLRALLGHDSESAAALGAAAQLSTGSLYHHLRDLMHAGLIAQEGRNRYQITPRGQRVLLLLLALAAEG